MGPDDILGGPNCERRFITEIDNMSYHLRLGERAKERVDTHGHVILTDEEPKRLSHTKALCTITCVVGTLWLVSNGVVVASFMSGFFTVLILKRSELFTSLRSLHCADSFIRVVHDWCSSWNPKN